MIKHLLQTSILLYIIFHFFTVFKESNVLLTFLALTGVVMFILSAIFVSVLRFKLPIFLFILAILILNYANNFNLTELLNGMLQMRNVIGMLVIIPLTNIVLNEEPYVVSILSVVHKFINTSKRFYFYLVVSIQVFSFFLLFGAIPIIYRFVNDVVTEMQSVEFRKYTGTALLRGFSLASLWVISVPSFLFAVETFDVPIWLAIAQGMGIAIIGSFLGVFTYFFRKTTTMHKLTKVLVDGMQKQLLNVPEKRRRKKLVFEFFSLLFMLFTSVLLFDAFLDMDLMVTIPLIIIVCIILFFSVKRRILKLLKGLKSYIKKDLLNQTYQLNIMIAAGLLIYSLQMVDFAGVVQAGVYHVQEFIPILNPLYIFPFIVILLGFLGLGPLTVMVLVAVIVKNLNLPYPPELIVLALTLGNAISLLTSPIIIAVLIFIAVNKLSAFTNCTRAY